MGTVQHPNLPDSRRDVSDVAAWAGQGWLPVDDVTTPEPAVDEPADETTPKRRRNPAS
jgi:hypothetical protein